MAIRTYVDKYYGNFTADVDCLCHGCLVRITAWDEENELSISFWEPMSCRGRGFLERIKAAWKMFRTGHGYEEVLICKDTAIELAEALQDHFQND